MTTKCEVKVQWEAELAEYFVFETLGLLKGEVTLRTPNGQTYPVLYDDLAQMVEALKGTAC